MLGGRTNHWGRISLRYGPDDFRRRSLDGLGDDWPITYDDLKPYYDEVDRFIGIFGTNLPPAKGCRTSPTASSCRRRSRAATSGSIKQAADKLEHHVRAEPDVDHHASRTTAAIACHYCGQCNRGCSTHSNFSSPSVLIPPAMATRRLTIQTDAMAREVTVGADGLATGVTYIDKNTGRENHVRARVVVLAASACESARILLNSRSSQFPQGVGNSTGNVGRYLTDSTGVGVTGFIPKMMEMPPHNEDGVGGMHLYMPWWLDNKKLPFPRGYHIEIGGGRRMPSFGFMGNIHLYAGVQGRARRRPASATARC